MDIFVVTASHFAQMSAVTSYHAAEREAHIAATERVNSLRADLDPEVLPPVNVDNWREGLDEAVRHRLAGLGVDISKMDHEGRAAAANLDVGIEKVEAQGVSAFAIDDRELATVLAALRGHQRRTCTTDLLNIATEGGRYVPLTCEEIDDLCERLVCGALPSQEANIVVELDGGLVEGVVADRPTKVRVVDYDVEGSDPDDLVMVPGDHPTPAFVSGWAVESVCVDPKWIASLDAARASEDRSAVLMAGE